MIYVKKNFKGIFLILGIVFILIIILFFNKSYAFENNFDNIPDISTLSSNDLNFPSKYDLRDVNGINYITQVKNQGSYGLCWAFAATTAFESSLKKSGLVNSDSNEWISPYQIDVLVSPSVKVPDINYVTTYRHSLADGEDAKFDRGLAFKALTTAYSAVLMDDFKKEKYDLYYFNRGLKYFSDEVYNKEKSNYYLTDYDVLTDINNISVIDTVKYYLYNYGGVIVGTISPSTYCSDFYADCYINPKEYVGGGHMMTIIGWDDSKNSWILQNSWGKYLKYVYLSYDSYVSDYIGIKGISSTMNLDNRYYSKVNNDGIAEYEKIPDNDEKINSIMVSIKKTGNYSIFISSDGENENFEQISNFNAYFVGRKTIDLSDSNIVLTNSKFSIKVVMNEENDISDDVYIFTTDINNTSSKKIYISDINDVTSAFQPFSIKFKSVNLEKELLSFKIKNENNVDVTNQFNLVSKYFSNNNGQYDYDINFDNYNNSTGYIVEAIYDGNIIATKSFNVYNFHDFDKGSGTENDPFIINSPSDFKTILSDVRFMNYSYKLGQDIDMTGISFQALDSLGMPFSGTLDGDNYSIINLNLTDNFIREVSHATIKNIKFKNCTLKELGWRGGLIGKSTSSNIENIYVDKGTLNINNLSSVQGSYGTIVGEINNSSIIKNVYSSMDINLIDSQSDLVNIGGIVGKVSETVDVSKTILKNLMFSGKINLNNYLIEKNIGGIIGKNEENDLVVSDVKLEKDFQITDFVNSLGIGYFIGSSIGNYKDLYNAIYYKNSIEFENELIKVIGNKDNDLDEYSNVYSIVNYDVDNNKYVNENSSIFLNKSTYKLDFDKIWNMGNNGPEIKALTIDLIIKDDSIGETNIFNIDSNNHVISNIKTNNGSITKKEFVEGFISFLGDIFTSDNQLVSSDEFKLKTGMVVRKNNIDYKIVLKGDVNDDGKVNVADIIILRRFLVKSTSLLDYQQIAGDINNDGRLNATDIIHLRRAIAGGYSESCELVWRNCE